MTRSINTRLSTIMAIGLVFCATAAQAQLVNHPWDGSANLYASQNDIGGNGAFATTYDGFTLSGTSVTTGLTWVGGYFNPASQGPISQWEIGFYANNGGIPGAEIASGIFGNNETFLGNVNGFPIYSYSAAWQPYTLTAGTYFVSVVADMTFPPEWGWATSATGANMGYQTFFGAGASTGQNYAFTLQGVPEPAPVAALGLGALGLLIRRRRKS